MEMNIVLKRILVIDVEEKIISLKDCPKPPPTNTGTSTSTNHERNNNNARVNHDPPRPPISGKAYMMRADKEEEDDANADTISI